jgi:hypothetical protein
MKDKKGERLDHIEALENVTEFLKKYRKWYEKNYSGATTQDDEGSNPNTPTPPPPPPNP